MSADPVETVREALDEAFVTSSGRSGRLYAEGETVAAEQWKQRALRLQKARAALSAISAELEALKLEHFGGDEHHKGCAREHAFISEVAGSWKSDAQRLRAERDEARKQLQRVARNNAWFEPDGPTPLEAITAENERLHAQVVDIGNDWQRSVFEAEEREERVRALVAGWRDEHQPDEVAEGLYICTIEGGVLPYRACPVRRCADQLEAALPAQPEDRSVGPGITRTVRRGAIADDLEETL